MDRVANPPSRKLSYSLHSGGAVSIVNFRYGLVGHGKTRGKLYSSNENPGHQLSQMVPPFGGCMLKHEIY